MFIVNILTIMELVLSIKYTYSFKSFKHVQFTYYKAQDSVFLTNPNNHNASYGIYVVGKTITVDIPKSVVNLSTIVNWKVVNLDKDRLMFVHNKKPQILINQKTIKQMKFPRNLTGSIITFGESEALHVPTIFNPNLTQPDHQWNYIELLYFNVNSETVIVSRNLPWLKDDDWKFIKEWKMTDYIHFDAKLYLLIQRSIFNEKNANVTQEISIIRLCLDKGSELISTAVEIHFARPEFQTNKIISAIFIYVPFNEPGRTKQIFLLITQQTSNQSIIHKRYFIDNFVSLFDKTAQECASAADNYTLMRHHLRSEVRRCQQSTYESCTPNINTVPSVQSNFSLVYHYHFIFDVKQSSNPNILFDYLIYFLNETNFCFQQYGKMEFCLKIDKNFNNDSSTQNVEVLLFGYPINVILVMYNNVRANESRFCFQTAGLQIVCSGAMQDRNENPIGDFQLHIYSNHYPLGYFRVTEVDNQMVFHPIKYCLLYQSCIQCMMYGLSIGCVWSNSKCDVKKENVTQTLNHCFRIKSISPLMFNASSPKTLTVELDNPLDITASQEYLVINAGPNNHCNNITINGSFISCSMNTSELGKFKIDVIIRNDRYADTISLSARSRENINIIEPKVDHDYSIIIILLVLAYLLLINCFFLIVYLKRNQKRLKKLKKKSGSREKKRSVVDSRTAIKRTSSIILSMRMNNLRIPSKSSSDLVGSVRKMSPVSKKLHPTRRYHSSKLKY